MTINLFVPASYDDLSPKQIKWLFKALVNNPDMNSMELKTVAFIRFSGLKIITKCHASGRYLAKLGKTIFTIEPEQVAQAVKHLDWILFPPQIPWCPDKLGWRNAPDSKLYELNFGKWLAADNLYQGYLQTLNPELLRNIASILLPKLRRPLHRWELEAIFRWFVSVKDFYKRRFDHFFADSTDENALGKAAPSAKQIEDAMNAQIRALTKGDISREEEILNMPVLRALTELNAQAREYQEIKRKSNVK